MATLENTPLADGRDTRSREAQVQVTLSIEEGAKYTEPILEEMAYKVLAAVEEHAHGVVLGPAVAWNIEHGEIDLDFIVSVLSDSEVHQRIGLVMSILERELPIARESASRTATAPLAACV
jgi:hypothetical protein